MNAKKHMILIKGEIKTKEVGSCQYNPSTQKMDVVFSGGKKYSYAYDNVEWLKEPKVLNPAAYLVGREGKIFRNIEGIYVFTGKQGEYWHICFDNGSERDYLRDQLSIIESCLNQKQARDVFEYIRQIAGLSDLKNKESGEKILAQRFAKMSMVREDTALAKYLNPMDLKKKTSQKEYIPLFPFGCNNSQYIAVKRAMENQISVIQGPPGTGKTQTILNIIANILMQGKTVEIVSNNNSATENVYEKLSSPKYNLGFIVAALGKKDNKETFIANQNGQYPDFSGWKLEGDTGLLLEQIQEKSKRLKEVFDRQEELAKLRQEQAQLVTEMTYFRKYTEETDVTTDSIKSRKKLSANQWMALWQQARMNVEERQRFSLLLKVKGYFYYGVSNLSYRKEDIDKAITTFQALYYRAKERELKEKISEIEIYLDSADQSLSNDLCNQSMALLKDRLAKKYEKRGKRTLFAESDLRDNSVGVLNEYPVILSTTFSSRNSLHEKVVYDYLIMDEASQVDIATGALALSCAKNVVIVGDTKQLPNVITEDTRAQAQAIFDSYHIDEGYLFTKSFLQSVLDVMPNVSQTLLKEHYRCHPKIIDFCNQKFYRGELVIMTEDKGEEDVLAVVKTAPGNHARNHYSQRQIDVIRQEIIPRYVSDTEEIGIIAPYKNQVEALNREFPDIEVATVHKFQGKEKDTIIISTVDDEISDFADDPYLINVAVSRAKKKLLLVVTGNDQTKERNITDLISYIQYHNFEVSDSKIYSVFDYLYKQYTEARKIYLQKHKKISEYDSENLMYALILDILSADRYACLDVVCHFPMNMLIKDPRLLNEEECKYAMNAATHIDFLVYNRISKKPILAIEVDGYDYHKEGTKQASRDLLKDHIMDLYQIPLLRFQTNGSEEKEKITDKLDEIMGSW